MDLYVRRVRVAGGVVVDRWVPKCLTGQRDMTLVLRIMIIRLQLLWHINSISNTISELYMKGIYLCVARDN